MCTINFKFSFSAPGKGRNNEVIYPSIVTGVVQVLRERRFHLQQAAYTLERAFLPARVALQRGEKLGRVDDVDLGRVGRFGRRTRFWKEERESVYGCVYFGGTEVLDVLAVVVEHEEERATSRHRVYHVVDALLHLLHRHVFRLAEMVELARPTLALCMIWDNRPSD